MKKSRFSLLCGGDYVICTNGNVYSFKGRTKQLKPYCNSCGYYMVGLCVDGIRKNYLVHRLVAEAFIDNAACEETVDHMDENKANNDVSNLQWVSREENIKLYYVRRRVLGL